MDTIITRRKDILLKLLSFNLILFLFLLISVFWVKYLKSSVLEYSNIASDEFNGTVYPISYVPNWLKSKNTNKSMNFDSDNFGIDEFIEIPKYDTSILADSSWLNKDSLLARYTYPVVYMGNYKLDYDEYAWSHPWVDIRAPIGTPVLSIANWVVIKVKNTETWDGKYVVIRHDNVKTINWIETVYSWYEHLNDIFVEQWSKISKWDVLGKVWITWITTTPHLHFQIDRKIASFHPYWPYTFKDATDVNLDFFWAVNAWLWKENAIAYTINPMDFIKDNININPSLNSAPAVDTVKAQEENNIITDSTPVTETNRELTASISDNIPKEETDSIWLEQTPIIPVVTPDVSKTQDIIKTEQIPIIPVVTPDNTSKTKVMGKDQIFGDIPKESNLYSSTKYLYENKITSWYEDKTFRPNNQLSRKEALIFIFKLYNLKLDSSKLLPFSDIPKNDFIVPYLQKALDLWLISRNKVFRPNDSISRAEFVTILIKASWKFIKNTWKTWFDDIKITDWYSPYVETFSSVFTASSKTRKFDPNNTFNRWQITQILYLFAKNK